MKSIRDKNNTATDKEAVENAASKYDGMNEEQLLGELYKSVAAEKQNGTFSASTLDEFVSFVSPSLDEKARARLTELVRMIKNQ